jgi:small subunit ribosomal protein S8
MKEEIARILKQEGYISEFEIDTESKPAQIKITMKFVNRIPALTGLKRISKPGLRKYVGSDDIPRVLGGMGVAILSTSRGVITGREARKENVGGELLALVW